MRLSLSSLTYFDFKTFIFDMENDKLHYLAINTNDEDWGIVVTTVGYQFISPKDNYPLSKHPVQYDFKPQKGRILNEYQLVYITKGCGYFSSQSVPEQRITAGTMRFVLMEKSYLMVIFMMSFILSQHHQHLLFI